MIGCAMFRSCKFTDFKWFVGSLVFAFFIILYQHWHQVNEWQHQYEINLTQLVTEPEHEFQDDIQIGEIASNCGIQTTCPDNSFPIHLSTGLHKDDQPLLCISGKYIIQKGLNGGGRGLNGAIIEPIHFQIVSVRNFDTYATNSTGLETWLQYNLLDNDIVVLFTFDEASKELSSIARTILTELGSGKIQDLHYRAQWYIITQKGTTGFTRYEKMTYSKNDKWGERIEIRECIAQIIPKENTSFDEAPRDNTKRISFCKNKKSHEWREFCGDMQYEPILPALLTNRSLIGNPVFSMPVYMYASINTEVLIASLESLMHQPGIHIPSVTILYQHGQTYVPALVEIFSMKSQQITFKTSSYGKIRQCIELNEKKSLNQKFIIIIEENTILSPDFLFYFAQLISTLQKDETLSGISAVTPNCYGNTGDVHLAYRIQSVPLLPILVNTDLKKRFQLSELLEIIVPDVSRAQGLVPCHLSSIKHDNWIERPQDLTEDRYFHKLVMLLQLSIQIDVDQILNNCSESFLNSFRQKILAIYSKHSQEVMKAFLKCFNTTNIHHGKFKGIFRLTYNENTVLLLGEDSPFFKSRPISD